MWVAWLFLSWWEIWWRFRGMRRHTIYTTEGVDIGLIWKTEYFSYIYTVCGGWWVGWMGVSCLDGRSVMALANVMCGWGNVMRGDGGHYWYMLKSVVQDEGEELLCVVYMMMDKIENRKWKISCPKPISYQNLYNNTTTNIQIIFKHNYA